MLPPTLQANTDLSNSRRVGLTLLEVVVVIAIVGVLVALLLPAIQYARETSRAASCRNNLHQLALAVHQFDAANRRFPPGRFGGTFSTGPTSTAWSWIAATLPHLENSALYEKAGIPDKRLIDSGCLDQFIAPLICPTAGDSRTRDDAGNLQNVVVGASNYKAVSGANWGADATQNGPFLTQWPNMGTNGSMDGLSRGDGVMWRNDILSGCSFHSVKDGASMTLLLGEDVGRLNTWLSWPYSNNAYGTCAIPLNFRPTNPADYRNSWSFRSQHSRGANFARVDGSVFFMSDQVNLTIYRALATCAGSESTQW